MSITAVLKISKNNKNIIGKYSLHIRNTYYIYVYLMIMGGYTIIVRRIKYNVYNIYSTIVQNIFLLKKNPV